MHKETSEGLGDADIASSPPWSPISSVPELSDSESVSQADARSPITPAVGVRFDDQVSVAYSDCEGRQSPASFSSKRSARSAHAKMRSYGTVSFIVDGTEHIVDSVLFRNLSDRWTKAIKAGIADDTPIELADVMEADFEALVEVLSNKGQFGDADLTFNECIAILRISLSWPLGRLSEAAAVCFDVLLGAESAERIEWGRMFKRSDWVDQGLGELCVRKDAPSLVEVLHLKKGDLHLLTHVRHLCSATKSGNTYFHKIFPKVPKREHLLSVYGCGYTYHRGYMYITNRHLCFSSIFGGTRVTVRLDDIKAVQKCHTAYLFPTAISIQTGKQTFVFIAFLSRDEAFDLLVNLREFQNHV